MLKKIVILPLFLGLYFSPQTAFAGKKQLEDRSAYEIIQRHPARSTLTLKRKCRHAHYSAWQLLLGGAVIAATAVACTVAITKIGQNDNSDRGEENYPRAEALYSTLAENFSESLGFIGEKIVWGKQCFHTLYNALKEDVITANSSAYFIERNLTAFLQEKLRNLTSMYQACDISLSPSKVPLREIFFPIHPCATFLQDSIDTMAGNIPADDETYGTVNKII